MPEPRRLLEDILANQGDLTEDQLRDMIAEKKRKIGGGYLTDQGALFLIASDLGITLNYSSSSDLNLKDLSIGTSEISVSGRILSIYPVKFYDKKDGSKGKFARLILFDSSDFARITLWDEKADIVNSLSLETDMVVRVLKGYVKAGLNGEPVVHIGYQGDLEIITDTDKLHVPTIDDVLIRPQDINKPKRFLTIDCITKSTVRYSEFTRNDKSKGSMMQFAVGDSQSNRDWRVVIWAKYNEDLMKIPLNSRILLVNVRSKVLPSGEMEFHGDEGTNFSVLEVGRVNKIPTGEAHLEGKLLSIGIPRHSKSGTTSVQALLINANYKLYTIIAVGSASEMISSMGENSIIGLDGRYLDELKVICDDVSSIKSVELENNLGSPQFSKVNALSDETIPVFCEVIALSIVDSRDITTKDGELIERAEVLVGDETGEIRLTSWRDDARMLDGIKPGQRLKLKGLQVKRGKDGLTGITTKPYSSIEMMG